MMKISKAIKRRQLSPSIIIHNGIDKQTSLPYQRTFIEKLRRQNEEIDGILIEFAYKDFSFNSLFISIKIQLTKSNW